MTESSRRNKVFSASVWVLVDKAFTQLVQLLLLIYLASILSPSDFGVVGMLSIFLLLSQSLLDSGFTQALVQRSKEATAKHFDTVFTVNIIISLLIYVVMYLSSSLISDFYNEPNLIDVIKILFLSVILNAFSIVPKAIFMINMDFRPVAISNLVAVTCSACVAVIISGYGLGYWALIYGAIVKSLISSSLLYYMVRWRGRFKIHLLELKQLFSFGSNLLIVGLISTAVQNMYSVMIGRFYNSTQVGYYNQGSSYTTVISFSITSVIQSVTYPMMTSSKNNANLLLNTYKNSIGIAAFICFPVMIGFACIAPDFVHLFLGESWSDIVIIIQILSLARLVTPISIINLNLINAIGRSDLYLKVSLAKIPITLLGLYLSIEHGVTWIVISEMITSFISFFINGYYPGKLVNFGPIKQIVIFWKSLFSSVIMGFGIYFIEVDISVPSVLVKVVLGIVFYLSLSWLLRCRYLYILYNTVKEKLSSEK